MKCLIVAVNAKYIHTSLAVRLLYLAARREHDASFAEYVIRDAPERIADDILSRGADAAAFSCYIWNIGVVGEVCRILRARAPKIILLLGGPEVTYDPAHFLETTTADYILQGEGEQLFPAVLERLEAGEVPDLPAVSRRGHVTAGQALCPLGAIEALGSPYTLPGDEAQKAHRILYFETSRGCPYHCAYCLSSREQGLRFFSEDYLREQIAAICACGAKTVKLLDRSFCADADHAVFVLDLLFRMHAPGQQFQIEVNADTMPERVTDFIVRNAPPGLLRLEVGIQSTYEPSNRAVGRIQDFGRLQKTVGRLASCGRCSLHLDLIAGLPMETRERFAQSFDEVYALGAQELQLGFLKLLRGTSLRGNADDYGYRFGAEAPYEITESRWMTPEDLKRIHIAEDMLEKYHNSRRFRHALTRILRDAGSPYAFFESLGAFFDANGFRHIGYQPADLFRCLDRFTEGRYRDLLLWEYDMQAKKRPVRWSPPTMTASERKRLLHGLAERYGFDEDMLFHHALAERLTDVYLLAVYREERCETHLFACEDLSEVSPDILL